MADSTSFIAVKDAAAVTRPLGTMLDGASSTQYPQHVPRTNSAPVSTANPLPVLVQSRLAVAPIASAALEASHVLKTAACTLYAINLNGTVTGWFLLFDAAAVPVDGAVLPIKAWQFSSSQPRTLDLSFNPPLAMAHGAVLVFSTSATPFTKIASASAMFSGEAV